VQTESQVSQCDIIEVKQLNIYYVECQINDYTFQPLFD